MTDTKDPKENPPKPSGDEKLRRKVLGPAAESFGKELAPLGESAGKLTCKAGQGLIAVIEGLPSACRKGWEWLNERVDELLKDVPDDKLVEPNPRIIGPTVLDLGFAIEEEAIREMYAKLAAADMNKDTKSLAHPSFVELIKQMTVVDTKVLEAIPLSEGIFTVSLETPNQPGIIEVSRFPSFQVEGTPADDVLLSINNLERLGLLTLRDGAYPTALSATKDDLAEQWRKKLAGSPEETRQSPWVECTGVFISDLGKRFKMICLKLPAE